VLSRTDLKLSCSLALSALSRSVYALSLKVHLPQAKGWFFMLFMLKKEIKVAK